MRYPLLLSAAVFFAHSAPMAQVIDRSLAKGCVYGQDGAHARDGAPDDATLLH
jgi:hypothetical protein